METKKIRDDLQEYTIHTVDLQRSIRQRAAARLMDQELEISELKAAKTEVEYKLKLEQLENEHSWKRRWFLEDETKRLQEVNASLEAKVAALQTSMPASQADAAMLALENTRLRTEVSELKWLRRRHDNPKEPIQS